MGLFRSNRRRSCGWRSAPWLLPLLLAGCQGTPFGDRLAGSFPGASPASPGAEVPVQGGAAGRPAASTPAPSAAPNASAPSPAAGATAPAAGKPPAAPAGSARPAGAPTAQPGPAAITPAPPRPKAAPRTGAVPPPSAGAAPYRITLRLPGADPAAPAELVTQALRAAGVSFEVETIERMPAAEAPVVRPAPAPR